MTTTRTLLRYAALTLAVVATTLSANAGIKSQRLLAKIAQNTPAAVIVDKGQEMKTAEKLAQENGGTALWGIGHSMEPLYAPGTAVVVKEIAYDDIKKGMTLVYRKANGGLVAHSVIDEDRRGYVVQGVNNDEPDTVSVNEKNIVGVIVAAYSTQTGGFHQTMAMNNTKNAKVVAMR